MTEQPNPNELLLITREELERCCSQMSAAGYKVSANYVEASVLSRSRPHPAPDCKECTRASFNGKQSKLYHRINELQLQLAQSKTAARKAREEAQQRIEQAIKELETMKADANARSSRAHRIEDGNWHGSCLCDAPDAELKVITKAIALLQAGRK